jgi:hypothetical protein
MDAHPLQRYYNENKKKSSGEIINKREVVKDGI